LLQKAISQAAGMRTHSAKEVRAAAEQRDDTESQYRYLDETRKKYDNRMVDWDTWIEDDIRLLE
jgi:ribosomal protein L20